MSVAGPWRRRIAHPWDGLTSVTPIRDAPAAAYRPPQEPNRVGTCQIAIPSADSRVDLARSTVHGDPRSGTGHSSHALNKGAGSNAMLCGELENAPVSDCFGLQRAEDALPGISSSFASGEMT